MVLHCVCEYKRSLSGDSCRTKYSSCVPSGLHEGYNIISSSIDHDKASPNQSLVSGHPPALYFEKPVYEDYNDIHRKDNVKLHLLSHHKTL